MNELDTGNRLSNLLNIKLSKIVQTCTACPSQWDAYGIDGTYYYIRYRWGLLSVNKNDVFGECIFEQLIGDGLAGMMITEEMLDITGFQLV